MPPRARLLALVLLLAGLTLLPAPGSADCARPSLAVGGAQFRPSLPAGRTVEVTGDAFTQGCAGAGEKSLLGCEDAPDVSGLTDVTLRLEQDGASWDLGTADAGTGSSGAGGRGLGEVSWRVRVPDDVEPGPARLVAAGTDLPVTIR